MIVYMRLFLFLIFGSSVLISAADVKDKWVTIDKTKNSYRLVEKKLNFTEAENNCKKLGGHLATIINSTYQETIFDGVKANVSDGAFWIGLTDYFKESAFQWTSGYPVLASTFWNQVLVPDKRHFVNCVGVNTTLSATSSWLVMGCEQKQASVCLKGDLPTGRPIDLARLNGSCPPDFFRLNNRCLKIVDSDKQNWNDARKACQALGVKGDLASVLRQDEQNVLTALMLNRTVDLWIGLHMPNDQPGAYKWVRNFTTAFTNWKSNEPNGHLSSNTSESETCVMMYRRNRNPGEWNDQKCSDKMGYICESDLLPKPETAEEEDPLFPKSSKCKPDEHLYNNFCYWEGKTEVASYADGEKQCATRKLSHLVSPHSRYESAFLIAFLTKHNRNETMLGYNITYNAASHDHIVKSADGVTSGIDTLREIEYNSNPNTSCIVVTAGGVKTEFLSVPCEKSFKPVCRYPLDTSPRHPDTLKYKCEKDWKKVSGGKCLRLMNDEKTFNESEADCKAKGGHLASISHPDEQTEVSNLATKASSSSGVWIGLNVYFDKEGTNYHMRWTDSSSVSYYHWRTGEPSYRSASGSQENCVVLRHKSHDWNNVRCSSKSSYVCQKMAQPAAPASVTATPTPTPSAETTSLVSTTVASPTTTPGTTQPTTTKPATTTKAPPPTTTPKATTPSPTTPKPTKPTCPSDFVYHFHSCYKVFRENTTYKKAQARCQSVGKNVHLASMHDAGEKSVILKLMKKASVTRAWIGLSDLKSQYEDQFGLWEDGTALTVTYFDANHVPSLRGNMDCVQMAFNGFWYITHCTYSREFVCKWSQKVTPNTSAVSTPQPLGGFCLPGFQQFGDYCYKLITSEPTTFDEADKACKNLVDKKYKKLAHLARVNHWEDNEFLLSLLPHVGSSAAWIGLHYAESGFHWTDNRPVVYTRWPVNMSHTGDDACVGLGVSRMPQFSGYWFARSCSDHLPYLCQTALIASKKPEPLKGQVKCPSGYTAYPAGGTCYKYFKTKHTFSETQQLCRDEDVKVRKLATHQRVSMLTLGSVFEMSFVRAWLTYTGAPSDVPFWLGLHINKTQSAWKWLDGTRVNFTYFTHPVDGVPDWRKDPQGCFAFKVESPGAGMLPHRDCDKKQFVAVCKVQPVLSGADHKPPDCRHKEDGSNYMGHRAVTKSGRPCMRWDMIEDIQLRVLLSATMPDRSLSEASNFCRNPHSGKTGMKLPYCYTAVRAVDGKTQPTREECSLPMCPGAGPAVHGYVVVVAILVIVLLVTVSFFVGVMLWRRTNTARGFIPYLRQHDPEGGTSFHNPIYTPAATC